MTLSYSVPLAVSMITGSLAVREAARSFFSTLRPSSSGSMMSSSTREGSCSPTACQNRDGRGNPLASMPWLFSV